jgi:hypothetical protein
MTTGKGRKKQSEKLSDSYAARLARDNGPADRQGSTPGEVRPSAVAGSADRQALAGMASAQRHSFTRCPHCREYVPIRDTCRGCGTTMT